ncbi:MAG: protein translocase subunit SecF [Bacteriovoracales bacterium]|nr:protein translocase subunit SecF [Bacteriovoracales bacterium]
MLEIIARDRKFQFSKYYKITSALSVGAVLVSLYLVFLGKGPNYGVDFRGGAEIQVGFEREVNLGELRAALSSEGIASASVQTIEGTTGHNYLIRVQADEKNLNEMTEKISQILEGRFAAQGPDRDRFKKDIVGPKAGAELRKSGFLAMLWALLAIFIYIGLRFDIKYSPGAIMALAHDVIIVCGIFVITDKEFNLQIVAALLAIIGYSVNDTVVVYDRVREHEEKFQGLDIKTHIDNATSETLSRTLLTSGTTLLVSLMMFFVGGGGISDFFFAISIGVLVGTYSSIFVAAPTTLLFEKLRARQQKTA